MRQAWYSKYTQRLKECTEVDPEAGGGSDNVPGATSESTRTAPDVDEAIDMVQIGNHFLQSLDKCAAYSGTILSDSQAVLKRVSKMADEHADASSTANDVSTKCTALLSESRRLRNVVEQVKKPLKYFNELETLGNMLGLPLQNPDEVDLIDNDDIQDDYEAVDIDCKSEEYRDILKRLQDCIEFMVTHIQYRDAKLYLQSFRVLERRALDLLKNHVIGAINLVAAETSTSDALSTEELEPSSFESLPLYSRWKMTGDSVRTQIAQLGEAQDVRVQSHKGEADKYDPVLECVVVYFQAREGLTLQMVNMKLSRFGENTPFNDLVRKSTVFLLRILNLEQTLYRTFFDRGAKGEGQRGAPGEAAAEVDASDGFYSMSENLVAGLYSICRAAVLSHNSIDELCDLVHILQSEILQGHFEDGKRGFRSMEKMIRRLLEDVQERLVYKVQTYMVENIELFVPEESDLDYPSTLQAGGAGNRGDASEGSAQDPAAPKSRALSTRWYPTLDTTLVCLSKVYRCVDNLVFESLAQDALSKCTETLIAASNEIGKKQSKVDASLFLIKHLLVLREQINPFDIHFSITAKQLDFTTTANAFVLFLRRISALFSLSGENAIIRLLHDGIPNIVDSQVNIKKDLESQLKFACETFILQATNFGAQPLLDVLRKHGYNRDLDSSTLQMSFSDACRAWEQCASKCLEGFSKLLEKLHLYLDNDSTENILIKPAIANIQSIIKRATEAKVQDGKGEEQTALNENMEKVTNFFRELA